MGGGEGLGGRGRLKGALEATTKLKPLFCVELVKIGRSRAYEATAFDNSWQYRFQGTTGISGMLDAGKSHGFARAAAKITVETIRTKLLAFGASSVVLEPHLIDDILAGCDTSYLSAWNARRDRGTDYHALLEKKFRGETLEETDEFRDIWTKLQAKLLLEGIDPIAFEVPCASLQHKIGTTIDAVGLLMGDYGVIDWKFAKFISSEHFFQVGGGSAQCFTETYGLTAKWAKVFRWDFAGKFWEVKTVKNTALALKGLLGLRDVKETVGQELYI